RHVAVGAHEAGRRGPDAGEHPVGAMAAHRAYPRAMRHGTYSIVARDPDTGELGAAVQSHWFSVGSLCTWARPGIGAVATQSVVEPAYGPDALGRLADGVGAEQALGELLAADALAAVRQVAVVDARGGVAVHTGEADELMAAGRGDEAGALYRRAAELTPENEELLFWAGLALAQAGDLDAGVEAVRRAAERHDGWLVLLGRLSPQFAPAAAAV